MLFTKVLHRRINIHPSDFGPKLTEMIVDKLKFEVENTCTEDATYITHVERIVNFGAPMLQPSTGLAHIDVQFIGKVFTIGVDEIVDMKVVQVQKFGIFGDVGPAKCFVPKAEIPSSFEYTDSMVNGVSVGTYQGEEDKIEVDTILRAKVIGSRVDMKGAFYTATISDDGLGPVDDAMPMKEEPMRFE